MMATDTFTFEETRLSPCDHDPSSPLVHVCEHYEPTGETIYVLEGERVTRERYEAATA